MVKYSRRQTQPNYGNNRNASQFESFVNITHIVNSWIEVDGQFFMHVLRLCIKYMHEKMVEYYSSVYDTCIL